MKKFALLLVLLLVPLAFGTDYENIRPGENFDDEGWNVTFIRVINENSTLFQVFIDPNIKITEQADIGEQRLFGGIFLNVTEIFYDENQELSFIDLETRVFRTSNCDEDSDCDDFDSCTIDHCIGYPARCDYEYSHVNITQCISGDGCCPEGCFQKNIDSDCTNVCYHDGQCNDGNELTNDSCDLAIKLCKFRDITECKTGDFICPDNCTYTDKMLPNRDGDCSQDSECIAHIDCDDQNTSTADFCRGEFTTLNPKKCEYENITYVPEEVVSDETPYREKLKYIFNEPLKASKEQIEQILKKQPYSKHMIITAFIVIAVALYYLLVISKIKPEERNIDHTSKNLKKP